MALTTHSNQPIPSAIHPSAYVQATDPGAVGANKQWVDTSTAQPYQLKVRNAANTAWLLIGVLSSGVTSVALVVPGELGVSGSPVTGAGTITIGKNQSATAPAIASGGIITTSGIFEARVAPTGAVTGVIMQAGTYAGQQCEVVNEAVAVNTITFAASGTSGVANGTGCVVAGLIKLSFVWDSVTSLWYPAGSGGGAGSVTSVGLTVPSGMVVAGSPVTGAGTLVVTDTVQSPNTVKAGPASGGAAIPTFRALTPPDIPLMGASGVNHWQGAVPDPGAVAGTTRFLREDGTFAVPAGTGGGGGGGMVPIQTQTVTGAVAASVIFSGIPTTYKNLRVTWVARGDTAAANAQILLRFNGDAGANYDAVRYDNSSGASNANNGAFGATSGFCGYMSAASDAAGIAGSGHIHFPTPADPTFQRTWEALSFSGGTSPATAAASFLNILMGKWQNTVDAITSITFLPAAGNFAIGSTFTLWGESDAGGSLSPVGAGALLSLASHCI